MFGKCSIIERIRKGFTLVEALIVIAIIGALIAVGIPVMNSTLNNARNQADLANMRSAYGLAATEWMTNPPDGLVAYYFNGSTLQSTATGLQGYGQSEQPASEFAADFPVEVTGTPKTSSKSNFLVVYLDVLGVARLSWGSGGYAGRQILTRESHTSLDDQSAEDLDVKLLDSLEEAVRDMNYGQIKQLIAEYGLKVVPYNGHSCIQIAICNVDQATRLPDQSKTKIYVPEFFTNAGYDVGAENLYVINSRDNYTNGDVIWLELGADINAASDSDKAVKAFTYVKSNGDTTNDPLRYDTRRKR